jgi:hypothetical protein
MTRREFLGIFGCAAAWPVASKAQTSERTRIIGVLEILGSDDPEAKTRSEAFAQTLQRLGWSVGRNVTAFARSGNGGMIVTPGGAAAHRGLIISLQLATNCLPFIPTDIIPQTAV